MPTGYTQDLADGKDVTFEQFAMKCARAFGALIEMRDEPMDAEIPKKFTTPPYYSERLERARARVTEVNSWTQQQAAAEADKAHAEAVEYREQRAWHEDRHRDHR